MFRVHAGEDISRAVTVEGSGALSGETFEAHVRLPSGKLANATATVTDAANRVVTVAVDQDEWARGEGGFGVLQLDMTSGGTTTVVHQERFRVMPGMGLTTYLADYGRVWI